ncbi:hypothetical protein GCM10007216_26610 [Thalassobacillus devorans]|uniref:DUF1657 domain-containing protein n=1 Tax=Thalassobacillus devorans TaxID=279813 RepID=A0ABQ1PCL6_9BACI|nr:DUF1657 domain-containing protein [Thalassobacillus devorans]NIK29162.1 hypothetical protein [Thalassobacillus devorans]GGC94588.1 hypothetical protein GCM10007216_26610 [Thalassobacillus devorans]
MTIGADLKQCLATIKSIEAGLSSLAINTNAEDEQRLYHEQMMVIEEIKQDLMKRIGEVEREEEQYKGF